jgi:hypothetical protein
MQIRTVAAVVNGSLVCWASTLQGGACLSDHRRPGTRACHWSHDCNVVCPEESAEPIVGGADVRESHPVLRPRMTRRTHMVNRPRHWLFAVPRFGLGNRVLVILEAKRVW